MKFRPDIEGLRALAIAPVVVFHAWPALLPGGFVGVDVFFVISGFLITTLLRDRLAEGRHGVAGFYAARVRRILPALAVVLLASAPLALFLLTPAARQDFAMSFGATVLFLSNLWFSGNTGYFDGAAELKPLLHTWSLAVEEQYYLFFPWLLVAAARWGLGRWLTPLLVAIALASLAYGEYSLHRNPSQVFYSSAARAFELMLGSLLALHGDRGAASNRRWHQIAGLLGLLGLFTAFHVCRADRPFPGLMALLPTLATAALIWSGGHGRTWAASLLALPPLRWVGALSYSLYLWHWPALVFTRHATFGEPSAWQLAAAVAVATLLAWMSLRWVETPIRRSGLPTRRTLALGLVSSIVLLAIAGGLWLAASHPKEGSADAEAAAAAADSSPRRLDCHATRAATAYEQRCVFGDASASRRIAVWGDSHGVELAWALGQAGRSAGFAVVEHTATNCPPSLGFSMPGRPGCPIHNLATLRGLAADARVDSVVLVARHESYFRGAEPLAGYEAGLIDVVRELSRAGKRVLLLGPIPSYSYPVPATLRQLRLRGEAPDAGQSSAGFLARQSPVLGLLDRVAAITGAERLAMHAVLCQGSRCRISDDSGRALYFDDNHLSLHGASLVAAELVGRLGPFIPSNPQETPPR